MTSIVYYSIVIPIFYYRIEIILLFYDFKFFLVAPLIDKRSRGSRAHTISLIAALIASTFMIIILLVLSVILYKRRQLYGGFYILSIPPSPDYFQKLDPTKAIADQVHKLPYFPEWEFPRNKLVLSKCHHFLQLYTCC